MMAESVNDVATVQRTLQRSIEQAEDELVAQARLTRDLQDDLLRTRMVEFEGLSDRLYRVVRLAAKETGKQVRLDIVGGSIEIDRGVLDRMTGAFEHLLRNCVSHGIELPDLRKAAGKDPIGTIVVSLSHEGNEVGVEFRDDGGGLDLARIRAKGEALRLLTPGAEHSDAELANLIFTRRLLDRRHRHRARRPRRRHGRRPRRGDRHGRPHRDRDRRRAGHVVQAGPAADDRGDAGGDAPLRREHRRRAVDAGRDRSPRLAGRDRHRVRDRRLRIRRRGAAVLLARRLAPARLAPGRGPGPDANRRGRAQRPAADRRPRRRSPRQPGSRRQESRPAALAPARPRRHDAARLGCGGADLQPGRAGNAVRRRSARRGWRRAPSVRRRSCRAKAPPARRWRRSSSSSTIR